MTHKKGQGAMEYLMTYGWAILVVVIVGVVLWQMGVFNPGGGSASSFSGFGLVKPVEWSCDASTGILSMQVTNGAGGSISSVDITAGATDVAGVCSTGSIGAGQKYSCNASASVPECASANEGDRYEVEVDLSYTSPTGMSRTSTGKVWGPAE